MRSPNKAVEATGYRRLTADVLQNSKKRWSVATENTRYICEWDY
jgi:hypothetical protein